MQARVDHLWATAHDAIPSGSPLLAHIPNDDVAEESVEKLESLCEREPDQSACIADDECCRHFWITSMS